MEITDKNGNQTAARLPHVVYASRRCLMTRTGEAILKAQQEGAHPIRYSTIRCGLNPKRKGEQTDRLRHAALQAVFQSVASRIGIYKHVVTLVANRLVIDDPSIASCGWKTFYDRTWSAVDAVASKKETSNDLHRAVASILAENKEHLPEKVLFDLRQQETCQLEMHTVEHIQTFPERLAHAMCVRVAEATPQLKWKAVDLLGKRAAAYALCCPTQLGAEDAALRKCGEGSDAAFAAACTERARLGDLVSVARSGKPFVQQFNNKTLHLLLPHLMRLSAWSEEWLDAHFAARREGESTATDDDDPVGDVRRWARSRLPKPCTALPIAKLKAAMVLYCCTEVETLLQNLRRKAACKKRARNDNAQPRNEWPAMVDKADFASAIFNTESFKGRRGTAVLEHGALAPKWRIASFRTDGVALSVTFVSGHAPEAFNASALMKRGYHIAEPDAKVDASTSRGLFFVGERRCDLLPTAMPVRATVVDPGFCKPVHVASVRTDSPDALADAEHWHITEEEWMRDSGRKRAQESERKRREGTSYGEAIKKIAAAGRRKSATSAFTEYVEEMLATLTIRGTELRSVARSAARWQQKRCLARFIGRLCDRLFDRSSTRPNKNETPPDAATREEQRRRLMELRQTRQQTPTVVFFGDATYGPTMRGHNAIPKKGILRELCHRGLTFLLDEYRTSKMCPCGHDELKTKALRLRAHKSNGAACPLLTRLGDKSCDRDALASLNMVSCALCALSGRRRPEHLCRTRCLRCSE